MRRVALLAVAMAVLTGCGAGAGASEQVRNVVNQFTVEIGQGNAGAACRLTTGELLTICREGGAQLVVSRLGAFTSLTIDKVVILGSTATVAFAGSQEVMTLAERGGKWLVSSA